MWRMIPVLAVFGCASPPAEGLYSGEFTGVKVSNGCDAWGLAEPETSTTGGFMAVTALQDNGDFSMVFEGLDIPCEGGGSFYCRREWNQSLDDGDLGILISMHGHFVDGGLKSGFNQEFDCDGDRCEDADHCKVTGKFEGQLGEPRDTADTGMPPT